MVVQTFKKKPVAIEAVRWPGDIATADFIEKWSQGKCVCYANGGLSIVIAVRTLEGEMNAKPGDWIIKGIKGEFYERGLLHPFLDYETPDPWLNEIVDPMDDQGYVHVSPRPGLGQDINWDYIREHRVAR